MAYKALYRKYRSSTFDEIYGQSHIVKTLQNSIKNNNIGHAYLFCGPRGTGKTSMAKLFAKALNCESNTMDICNECENCKLINSNSHPDVIELDAASNSGVDDIRSIIEKVSYSPIKGKYKVYIIDEVHMLSNSAFNALLKTLEEPPSYVVFILATTEPYKVLPTILSRCQRYDFTKVSNQDIKNRLLDIMKKEDIKCEDDALNQIVDLADGGLRDALSILDQLVAFCNKDIKFQDLVSVFGLVSNKDRLSFLINLFRRESKTVLEKYTNFMKSGVNIKLFNDNLIIDLKDILIYRIANSLTNVKTIPLEALKEIDSIASTKVIENFLNRFIECCNDFKNVSNIYSYYEIVLIELMSKEQVDYYSKPNQDTSTIDEKPSPKQELNEKHIEQNELETSNNIIEKTKPIMINFNHLEGVKTEDLQTYSNDLLIKAIVKSSKSEKIELMKRWSMLDQFRTDELNCKLCDALSISSIFAVCDELIILQTNNKQSQELLNLNVNQKVLSLMFEKIIGKHIRVYTLSESESIDLTKLYLNLRQINKLPLKESIGDLFK